MIYTSCPVADTETIDAIKSVQVHDGRYDDLRYTIDVAWLAETEARIAFRHKGHTIHTGATFNDFYGFGSSIGGSVNDAEAIAENLGAEAGGAFAVELDLALFLVPVHAEFAELWKGPRWKRAYRPIYQGREYVFRVVQGPAPKGWSWPVREVVETHTLQTWEGLWTSADPEASRARMLEVLADLRQRYPLPEFAGEGSPA